MMQLLTILAEGTSKTPPPQVLVMVGMLLVIGSLVWMGMRRSRRNQPEARTHAHAEKHNSRLESQARQDIDELMVRLEEVSREICGKVDTRFARLEQVIAEADQKLAALKAVLRRQDGNGDSPPFPVAIDPKHLEVCRRFNEGQAVVAIAREMGLVPGEVELIVSLERSRKAADAADAPKLRT
jgi:hypothetical protein